MKRLQYKILIPGCLAIMAMVLACGKNYLVKPPLAVLSPEILSTKAGVQGILVGAYADLDGLGDPNLPGTDWGAAASNWTYGEVAADDSYKGSTTQDQPDIVPLMQWNTIATNSYTQAKWAAMYDGIQRANSVIRTMRAATGLAATDTVEFKAEALFLRAFYHFELRKVFHYPPYVDESVGVSNANVPNIDGSGNYIEIWPNIEADFQYAMANLPSTQPNKGQANKYAAEGFLAKVYMFEQKYDLAKPLLDDMIATGVTASGVKYALQTNYQENFNPDPGAKNSSESVFAVQMSVNDGSAAIGDGNGNAGDELNFPYGAGPGACCGFDCPSQDLANAYKTDVNGLPLLGTAFQSGLSVSDPANPYVGNVDPRIDWVMGRQGIPYLDWGNMPGDAWMRSPADDGHFCAKKNVYAKAQQGTYSDAENNWANVELDANNVNLIRFADVLLYDAECNVLGSTVNLDQAQTYVNMIRARAASPTGMVYTNGNFDAPSYTYKGGSTPADSYKVSQYPGGAFTGGGPTYAMNAIIMERRIELAEEGGRWFDLQRWQAGAGPIPAGYMTTVLQNYATEQAPIHPAQYFPIPQQQIDAENSTGKIALKQIPGY